MIENDPARESRIAHDHGVGTAVIRDKVNEHVGNMDTVLAQDVIVVMHTSRPPSDDEWQRHLNVVRGASADSERLPFVRMLVVTSGGVPSLKQRLAHKALSAAISGERIPVAVVTDDIDARRAVDLFALLGFNIQAFTTAQIHEAREWLHLDAPRAEAVAAALERADLDLGRPRIAVVDRLRAFAASREPAARLEAERLRIARDLHDGLGSAVERPALALASRRSRRAVRRHRPRSRVPRR